MGRMQQRKRNVLRKKAGRLSVVFDEREWGGRHRDRRLASKKWLVETKLLWRRY
jgi:hypothetical protein